VRRRGAITVAAGLAATGLASLSAPPAASLEPRIVSCGEVVTTSVLVANDLTECPEHGLVVGADGITVDLDGHVLDGTGLGAGVLIDGHYDVRVTGGTLREFDVGVHLQGGAGGNALSHLVAELNQDAGVLLSGAAPGNEVYANTFADNALAVGLVDGTRGAIMRDNLVATGSDHAVTIIGSSGNRVEGNDLTGASDGGLFLSRASNNVLVGNAMSGIADGAVIVEAESNTNLIEGNTITASEGGVLIDSSMGNQVVGNVIHDMSDDGVDLEEAHHTVVLGNDLRFNAGGVELLDSTENRIEANVASESAGSGVAVEGASLRNAIVRNVSNGNASFGVTVIGVVAPEDGNLLLGNQTNGNASGGIQVSVASHTVQANEARNNGGWGIYAGVGSIDGGYNTASGNKEPAQCFGVVCLPNTTAPPDTVPPDTTITEAPRAVTVVPSATFEFTAGPGDPHARFECALDGAPFEACAPPHVQEGLTSGPHSFAVRAIDLGGNVDPTPAHREWAYEGVPTVDCGPDVTVHADADAWIDQNSATSNKGSDSTLKVRSKGPSDNFRTLVRFPLAPLVEGCEVDAATLRVNAEGTELGRTLEAWRVAEPWSEATVTWQSQPDTAGPPAEVPAGEGFRSWNVKRLVQAMYDSGAAHGFLIRDADEGDDAEHGFSTREDEFGPEIVIRFAPVYEAPPVDVTAPETFIDSGPEPFVFSSNEAGSSFECFLDDTVIPSCTSPFDVGPLEDGPHTFNVAATDSAGNVDPTPAAFTWTVQPPPDTTPPQSTIDDGPTVRTTDTTATFAFSADEPASFACALDDDEPSTCQSPVSYADLGLGMHTFSVTAIDLAGNVGPTALWSWTIDEPPDHTAPETAIDSGPPATTTDRSATFTFAASEEGSTFECSFDAEPFAACAPPATYMDLTIGDHLFQVRATDPAGNTDPEPARWKWTVLMPRDTTPPDTVIGEAPPSPTTDTSARFAFSSDDPTATFECQLDDHGFAPCISPVDIVGVAEGDHAFSARAVDAAGNVDPDPAIHRWTVDLPDPPPDDSTPPRTTITSGPPSITSVTSATFAFAADDPMATFECALAPGGFAPCSSPVSYGDLEVGEHSFSVRATDPAGNTEDPPATHRWFVVAPPDTSPPTVTILGAPPATTFETVASFTFATDEPATTECSLDGADFDLCTGPVEYQGLSLGPHSFVVRATDEAGNVGLAGHGWMVLPPPDTTPPAVTIVSGPPPTTDQPNASFTFTTDEQAAMTCSLDGAAFSVCTSPRTYAGLPLGPHTFTVRAIDLAGNIGAASWHWTVVDLTPPGTTITSAPASPTTSTSATFRFTATEAGTRFECRLDGTGAAAFAPCTSPSTYAGLAIGSHSFDVRAVDAAGNVDATPAGHAWTIVPPPDTTAPQTTITAGPPSSASITAAFEFVSSESGSRFDCRLDAGAWLACTSPRTYVNLPVGSHRFEVRAIDVAGNVDPTPAQHAWSVESPPPPPPPGQTCSVVTLTATADAWLDENSAATNKGNDSILKVQSKGPHDNFRALVRFDGLPSVPAGCVVGRVTLHLHAASASEDRTLLAQRTSADWSEAGVTWATQPAAAGPTSTAPVGPDAEDVAWNVAAQVLSAYDAGRVSFLVRDAVEGEDAEQQFHSREKGENPPRLVIEFVEITS
jgi:parallel beta-helix repeat protein